MQYRYGRTYLLNLVRTLSICFEISECLRWIRVWCQDCSIVCKGGNNCPDCCKMISETTLQHARNRRQGFPPYRGHPYHFLEKDLPRKTSILEQISWEETLSKSYYAHSNAQSRYKHLIMKAKTMSWNFLSPLTWDRNLGA